MPVSDNNVASSPLDQLFRKDDELPNLGSRYYGTRTSIRCNILNFTSVRRTTSWRPRCVRWCATKTTVVVYDTAMAMEPEQLTNKPKTKKPSRRTTTSCRNDVMLGDVFSFVMSLDGFWRAQLCSSSTCGRSPNVKSDEKVLPLPGPADRLHPRPRGLVSRRLLQQAINAW